MGAGGRVGPESHIGHGAVRSVTAIRSGSMLRIEGIGHILLKSFTNWEKKSGSNSFFISFCMIASALNDDFGVR